MKLILRNLTFFFLLAFSSSLVAQTTIFSENVGTPVGTTLISLPYTGWQNYGVLTYAGTADVRTSTASTGYTGVSGSGNVFLTNIVGKDVIIGGINSSGYSSLTLTFGIYKSTTTSTGADLVIEYSTNGGTSYTTLTTPTLPSGVGTAAWTLQSISTGIPASTTLSIRFRQNGTVTQYRLDDIKLTGSVPPSLTTSGTLSAFSTNEGVASASQSFSVTGSNLTANVSVTAPSGFAVSTSASGPWTSSVSLTPSSGAVSQTIYVIVPSSTTQGSYSGDITVSSTGATDQLVPVTATVGAATLTAQSISFTLASPVTYGASPITLNGTATSALTVSYTSSNTAVATVSGNTLTIVGAGSTTITASQAGDASYQAAADVTQTLVVDPAALTITGAAVTDHVYDNTTNAVITGTLSGVIGADVVTFSGTGTFAQTTVGTGIAVTSTSTLGGANAGNYTLTQPTGLTGNITPASQTVFFSFPSSVFLGDGPFTLTATVSPAGGTITFSNSNGVVADLVGATLTLLTEGTTTLTASVPADANHTAGSTSVTVLVRSPIAKWKFDTLSGSLGTSATYTGTAATLGVSANVSSSSSSGVHASATTAWNGVGGNGSAGSLSSSAWAIGDYYAFSVPTYGFHNIHVSCDQTGSNTGPKDFKLEYSIDGTNFTTVGTYSITNDSWSPTVYKSISSREFDLSSYTNVNGAGMVYFRVTNTSTLAINGTTTASGGTSRIDNFTVFGDACPAEICANGIDDNCNGQIDEGCPAVTAVNGLVDWCPSFTGNVNFTTANLSTPYDVSVYLTAAGNTSYTLADLIGSTTGVTSTTGSVAVSLPSGVTAATDYVVTVVANDGSVTVSNVTMNVPISAICLVSGCTDNTACNYNALANNNDGSCTYPTTWYLDADLDSYAVSSTSACVSPGVAYVASVTGSGDCDDTNSAIHPGATEVACNNIDDNCNSSIDEGSVYGCNNSNATNYNAAATCDDGSCTYSAFGNGNVVALRVGDGSATLGSGGTVAYLEEFSTTGFVNSFALPTTGSTRSVVAGSSTSEGFMSLTPDFSKLVIPGYDAAVGTITVATTGSNPRVVSTLGNSYGSFARVASNSSFFAGSNFRSATGDGSNYWGAGNAAVAANGGVNYFGTASTASGIYSAISNTRVVSAQHGNLFFSTASGSSRGIYQVGSGLPTSSATATALINTGATGDAFGFAFNSDMTVCYVADNTAGIQKWTNSGSGWTLAYTIGVGASTGARGITVDFHYGPSPRIYAVTASSTSTQVIYFDDNGTTSPSILTLSTLLSTTNSAYRSVAFAPCTATAWYADADGDGYGNPSALLNYCVQPYGYVSNSGDCDDAFADTYPSATELCDGRDNDCDGTADDGLTFSNYYADADADGYGTGTASNLCSNPGAGYATNNTDCDDGNTAVHPGAIESCANTIDDNCNGTINEGCNGANTPGENPTNATYSPISFWPTCSSTLHTLAGFNPSNFGQSTCLTGEDKWHYFTATSEAVSIQVSSTANDIVIELQTVSGTLLAAENAVAGLGGEIMNYSGLTSGTIYRIGVRNYDSSLGIGTYTLCVKSLKRGGCDTGTNPSFSSTLNLCKLFKATWAGTGASYRYEFTGTSGIATGNTYTRTQNSDYLAMVNVAPTMPLGCAYNVLVTNIYTVVDGAGNSEVIEVPALASCTITMENEPATNLRAADRCTAGPRFRGAIVASLPWVCGVTNWKWEFTEVNVSLNPVGIPIYKYRGAASNYLNLSTVTALQYGKTYAVRTAPIFSYGEGAWGPTQYLCIIGTAGMVLDGNAAQEGIVVDPRSEIANEAAMAIYPNPSTGEVTLNVSGITASQVQVRMVDAMGRQLMNKQVAMDGFYSAELNLNDLANGLYLVEIVYNGEALTQRLMIQK